MRMHECSRLLVARYDVGSIFQDQPTIKHLSGIMTDSDTTGIKTLDTLMDANSNGVMAQEGVNLRLLGLSLLPRSLSPVGAACV